MFISWGRQPTTALYRLLSLGVLCVLPLGCAGAYRLEVDPYDEASPLGMLGCNTRLERHKPEERQLTFLEVVENIFEKRAATQKELSHQLNALMAAVEPMGLEKALADKQFSQRYCRELIRAVLVDSRLNVMEMLNSLDKILATEHVLLQKRLEVQLRFLVIRGLDIPWYVCRWIEDPDCSEGLECQLMVVLGKRLSKNSLPEQATISEEVLKEVFHAANMISEDDDEASTQEAWQAEDDDKQAEKAEKDLFNDGPWLGDEEDY